MTFGQRISDLLKEKRVSNYRLAKDLGIAESAVRKWRKDETTPRSKTLQKIADYFSISPVWLLYGDEAHAPTLGDWAMSIARRLEKYVEKHPGEKERIEAVVDALVEEKRFRKAPPVQRKRKGKAVA